MQLRISRGNLSLISAGIFLNYFSPLKRRCFFRFAPCRDAASKGPPLRRPRPTPSFRHPIQFAYVRVKARFISAALIKKKVTSLKENRADNVRREVAWNQERTIGSIGFIGFGWGNAIRAVT
jgi:hypothetical protein